MRTHDVATDFLVDAARHTMKIHQDNGIYRHIEFSRPGTNCYRFDLVTWPGYLTISGDMGTWTFSRVRDMFEFFDGGFGKGINVGYWTEKLQAGSGCNRDKLCKEFDTQSYQRGLREWLAEYLEDNDNAANCEQAQKVIEELCSTDFNDEREASDTIYNADFPDGVSTWDILEGLSLTKYSWHIKWILYAIVWGVERYNTSTLADKAMSTFLAFTGVRKEACND